MHGTEWGSYRKKTVIYPVNGPNLNRRYWQTEVPFIWKSRHQHQDRQFLLAFRNAFEKQSILSNSHQYSFLCLVIRHWYGINLLQLLISQTFYINLLKGVHWCSRKKTPKFFRNITVKHPRRSLFKLHLQPFLSVFQKVVYDYSVENLLVPASVKRISTADLISGAFRNFKNTQGGRLQFVDLRNSITYRALPRNSPKLSEHL